MPALGSFSGNFSCGALGKLNAAGVYGGGTTSTTGTSLVYIFTTTSTIKVFTTSGSLTVEILAVGAGGAGRAVNGPYGGGGGGGIAYRSAATLTNGTYLIQPGRGIRGASGGSTYFGNSSFSLTALGGGYGGGAFLSTGGVSPSSEYTVPGTYSWTCPVGVTSVCAVAVGGGGGSAYGGGGGGGLGWKNNIAVTPGQTYTVVVGAGGTQASGSSDNAVAGNDSYFINASTVRGGGGGRGRTTLPTSAGGTGGDYTGDGGGRGGDGGTGGGSYGGSAAGGAGGYTGNGGAGGNANPSPDFSGSPGSGGGGGGGGADGFYGGGGGGGVGLYGLGSSGSGGSAGNRSGPTGYSGTGGSGGLPSSSTQTGAGGSYGGGGYTPASGAVRIVWGTGVAFPSTGVGGGVIIDTSGAPGGSGGGGTNSSAGGAALQPTSTSGGFGAAGTASPSSTLGGVGGGAGGSGADGKTYSITGFATLYGGGGGSGRTRGNGAAGTAGTGGGGLGGGDTSSSTDGTDGLGGGGGGGYNNGVITSGYTRGGNGVVILRYSQSAGAGGPVIIYPYTSPISISSPRGQVGPGNSSPNFGQSIAEFQSYFINSSQSSMSTAIGDGTNVTVPGAAGYLFFTIPEGGTWNIYAVGGSGGYTNKPSKAGSAVGGDFVFASGDVIWITIGELGAYGNSGSSDLAGGAGGGMTVVAKSSSKSKTFSSGDMTPLLVAAGGLGQTEGRHGGYAADSSASDGAGGSGFYSSWLSQGINGSNSGYAGQYTYGGFGGGTGTDDGFGGAGGYDGLFSGGPNSYVSPSAANVVRYNSDPLRGAYNQGFVRLTKL